jgi:phosphoketolase
MIKKYDLDAFVISGPGHGAPGLISNFYLEGVWSETYGNTPENKEGLQRFFKQFSFPGGHGSHMTPEVSSTNRTIGGGADLLGSSRLDFEHQSGVDTWCIC